MNVTVVSGKGDKVRKTEISLTKDATVQDLKKAYAKTSKKDIHRISFKIGDGDKVVKLDSDKKALSEYDVADKATIQFKDLGAQIGYRTVFLVEYFGPMVFVLFYYLRPAFLYGANSSQPYNWVAKAAVACWVAHFLKRELETLFVHKFSRPTMPLNNLFKNCAYYWSFGAIIGYPLCAPSFAAPGELQVYIGLAIFLLSELGNLKCHLMLSNMRPKEGAQDRSIPRGFLFELVACPNYTFEVLSWVGFSIMTNLIFSYLFTFVGFLQMTEWAIKKHKGYKKTYDKEYTQLRRKAIVPFVI
jgi:very-long-chain enoyl-CoA reductase